jgi:hypothetical protein
MTSDDDDDVDTDQEVVPVPLAELRAERAQLLLEKQANNEILASCRAQIEAAKARRWADNVFDDPKWFAAVNSRARFAGHRDQAIARRLTELRGLIGAASQREHKAKTGEWVQNCETDPAELLLSAIKLIGQAIDLLRAGRADDDP